MSNSLVPVADRPPAPHHGQPFDTWDVGGFDLQQLWGIIVRRAPLGLAVGVGCCVLILALALQVPPTFYATSTVLVDPRKTNVVNVDPVVTNLPADTSVVDTEVEVLKTRAVAARVVQALDLAHDPEFSARVTPADPAARLVQKLLPAPAPRPGAAVTVQQLNAAVDQLMAHRVIRRSGLTYVIQIGAFSSSPAKASRIANTFADQYLARQSELKAATTRQAELFLNNNLEKLRAEAEAAQAAVQQYQNAHDLLSANGQTMAEQEASQLSGQIAQSQADYAEKLARLTAAQAQLRHGGGGADVGAALGSGTITELRKEEAEASKSYAQLTARYGPMHPAVTAAQSQLNDISRQVQLEIDRIISSLTADAQSAQGRLASLQASLGQTQKTLALNNAAQAGLLALQQRADAASAIYDAYLTRAKQIAAQDGLDLPDSQIASRATAPMTPVSPNLKLAAAGGVAAGLFGAIFAMSLAELWDGTVRRKADVERKLDVPFAGILPDFAKVPSTRGSRGLVAAPADYVVDRPFSAFAESFRSLRAFLMLWGPRHGSARVVAITSALPREGKTMISLCLTRALVQSGANTLIIDCDTRRSGMTQMLGRPEAGLVEVLQGKTPLERALMHDPRTNAWVLPSAGRGAAPQDLLTAPKLDELLEALKQQFDYIILDTPPILAVADARILAAKADAALMIVEWNKTPARAAASAVELLQEAGANVVGAALNKVDVRAQARYGFGDSIYAYKSGNEYFAD